MDEPSSFWNAFTLQPGDAVQYNRHAYRIRAAVSLTTVRIEDCGTGQTLVVPVTALEASEAQTSTSIGDDIGIVSRRNFLS